MTRPRIHTLLLVLMAGCLSTQDESCNVNVNWCGSDAGSFAQTPAEGQSCAEPGSTAMANDGQRCVCDQPFFEFCSNVPGYWSCSSNDLSVVDLASFDAGSAD